MSIQRETYTELLHSMVFAWAESQLSLPQVSSVLWACAQPSTTEETIDMTHEIRDELTDWSELDKGMLITIETVLLTFNCVNIHGVCSKGKHTVAMTRVVGSTNWEPERVSSVHNFNQIVLDATVRHKPGETLGDNVVSHVRGSQRDLINAFRDMFNDPPEVGIDKEVTSFREELDKLFPSAPSTQGKESDDQAT